MSDRCFAEVDDFCEDEPEVVTRTATKPVEFKKASCPECGEEITFEGGCNICKSCGWSKCD